MQTLAFLHLLLPSAPLSENYRFAAFHIDISTHGLAKSIPHADRED